MPESHKNGSFIKKQGGRIMKKGRFGEMRNPQIIETPNKRR
jgi:hypothetical protein